MAEPDAFSIDVAQWPKYSGFKVLQAHRREIRLLQLEPGANHESLRYTISHVELGNSPDYAAVSYAWGPPVPRSALREIFLNEESVRIRPTLYSFLETMSLQDLRQGLWIDSLSIDQSNVEERNRQISMMDDIYRSARKLYVWLDGGDDSTNYAMEHIGDSERHTPFNLPIFSACAERLLTASYWTRRWVIQEFALAQEVIIVCGRHFVSWNTLTDKLSREIFQNDVLARRNLERFKEVRLLPSSEPMSLLDLMDRFEDARCIDPRDKALALRGIAKNGFRLLPRYDESVADLYFRVLSTLPTERVLPEQLGYRWPHKAPTRLIPRLRITREDLLQSLTSAEDDRLFTVFEYAGVISSLQVSLPKSPNSPPVQEYASFPFEVQLEGSDQRIFLGSKNLAPGDLVYSLQVTPASPEGLYLVFAPDQTNQVVGMLVEQSDNTAIRYLATMGLSKDDLERMRLVVLRSVFRCSRNAFPPSMPSSVLCHINRSALVMLWLLECKQVHYLWNHQPSMPHNSGDRNPICSCRESEHDPKRCLEVLPSFDFKSESSFWADKIILPWVDGDQQHVSLDVNDLDPFYFENSVDFRSHERTGLSLAAERGYISFIEHFLARADVEINSLDRDRRTALWYASAHNHKQIVKILLSRGANVNAGLESDSALAVAAKSGNTEIVQMLLDKGANTERGGPDHTALLLAALNGKDKVVEILLDAGSSPLLARSGSTVGSRDLRRYGDVLAMTALQGHSKVVKVLLNKLPQSRREAAFFAIPVLYIATRLGYEQAVRMGTEMMEYTREGLAIVHASMSCATQAGYESVLVELRKVRYTKTLTGPSFQFARQMANTNLEGLENLMQFLLDERWGTILENFMQFLLHGGGRRTLNIHETYSAAVQRAIDHGYENLVALLNVYLGKESLQGQFTVPPSHPKKPWCLESEK